MNDSSDTPDRTGRSDRSGESSDSAGASEDTRSGGDAPEAGAPDAAIDATSPGAAPSPTHTTPSDTTPPGTTASDTVADPAPPDTGAPPRKLLVAAAVLALAMAAGVGALGLFGQGSGDGTGTDSAGQTGPAGPLALVSIPAPKAGSDACRRMLEAVPGQLTSSGQQLKQRELAKPAPAATAAWGRDKPVVLRCGLERPPELTRTASLRQINGVQWLHVPAETGRSATWYIVDRPVYLALTVPEGTGTGPLQRISDLADQTLKQVRPTF